MNTMMSVCAALNPPDDSHRAFVVLAHGREEGRQNSFLSNFNGSQLACSGVNVGCFSLFQMITQTSFWGFFYDMFFPHHLHFIDKTIDRSASKSY